jgi:hypothetical protein
MSRLFLNDARWSLAPRALVALVGLAIAMTLFFAAPALAGDAPQKPLGDIPIMHEEAAAAGLNNVYDGPWEYFVGGGGAAFDCDGSGFPSVFLAGGKNPARLFVNKSKAGGALKFEEKALDIGADPKLLTNVIGAYPLDIDGDGHMDLFVLRVGGNLMLKGGPDCTFTLANHEWNFDGDTGWTTSFAAEWEPGQKFPTLAIGHYVDRDAPGSPWGTCADNSLYRPQAGDKPDYSVRTPLAPGFCALSMLFTDWNKSGTPSLRVSNDRQYYRGGEEQMWRIALKVSAGHGNGGGKNSNHGERTQPKKDAARGALRTPPVGLLAESFARSAVVIRVLHLEWHAGQ